MAKARKEDITVVIDNLDNMGSKIAELSFGIEDQFKEDGKKWFIHASNYCDRSAIQNGLMWTYIAAIADKMGVDCKEENDAIAARLKRKFAVGIMKIQAFDKGDSRRLKVKKELYRYGIIDRDEEIERLEWVQLIDVKLLNMKGQIEAFKLLDATKNFKVNQMCTYLKKIEIWGATELGLQLESINEEKRRIALGIK